LFRGDEPISSLGHRAVALLRVLVEQRGILVSKDALMNLAWADLTVGRATSQCRSVPYLGCSGKAANREQLTRAGIIEVYSPDHKKAGTP
jgi:hypothetical protein